MGDGYLNKCKECTKLDTRKNREENLEYYQEYDRIRGDLPHRKKLRKEVAKRWGLDPELRKKRREQVSKWSETNAIKRAAHYIVFYERRSGRLAQKPCEVCGKMKVHAHHDDYSKPLDIKWLCAKHHGERHRELNRLRRSK